LFCALSKHIFNDNFSSFSGIPSKQEKGKQIILVINSNGDVWKVSVTENEELKKHLKCPDGKCHTDCWSEK